MDKGLGDESAETYWPLVKQAILLGYNSDKIAKDAAPKDWTDLWTKDEFKSRYERVTGMGTATAQLVFAGILTRYRDDSGDSGISDDGWKQVEAVLQERQPRRGQNRPVCPHRVRRGGHGPDAVLDHRRPRKVVQGER